MQDLNPTVTTALKQTEAVFRSQHVELPGYELAFQLKKETFAVNLKLTFGLKSVPSALFLDFIGKTINKLVVNGTEVSNNVWDSARLHLPADLLVAGSNIVLVDYENEYDHHGEGFHSYVDPEDQQVSRYLVATNSPDSNTCIPTSSPLNAVVCSLALINPT